MTSRLCGPALCSALLESRLLAESQEREIPLACGIPMKRNTTFRRDSILPRTAFRRLQSQYARSLHLPLSPPQSRGSCPSKDGASRRFRYPPAQCVVSAPRSAERKGGNRSDPPRKAPLSLGLGLGFAPVWKFALPSPRSFRGAHRIWSPRPWYGPQPARR